MNLLNRMLTRARVFLATRTRGAQKVARTVYESGSTPTRPDQEVWGRTDTAPTGGWRLLGRDDGPLADYFAPGLSDISLDLHMERPAPASPAVSSSLSEDS